jgi:hypothetical protein
MNQKLIPLLKIQMHAPGVCQPLANALLGVAFPQLVLKIIFYSTSLKIKNFIAVCSSPGNICCAQALPAAIPATGFVIFLHISK